MKDINENDLKNMTKEERKKLIDDGIKILIAVNKNPYLEEKYKKTNKMIIDDYIKGELY